MKEKIPSNTVSIRAALSCTSEDIHKQCATPIVESPLYTLAPRYIKILVIDASREKDKINVSSLRKKIEEVY